MPGSLAELYGALLKQEPQGVLGAARFNPLMMAKALRQQQANPRPSLASLMNYPQTWQQFGDNIQANYPIDSPAAVRQAAFEAAKNAGPLSVKKTALKARDELLNGSPSANYEELLRILRENDKHRPELLKVLYPEYTSSKPLHPWAQDIWMEATYPQKAGIGLARINYPEISSRVRKLTGEINVE